MAVRKIKKIIKKSKQAESFDKQDELFGVANTARVAYGVMSHAEELKYVNGGTDFKKSDRSDYGRDINIKIPQGYHGQVKKSWELYSTDRFFKYLIDRAIDFGANGFEWEVPTDIPLAEFVEEKNKKKVDKAIEVSDADKKVWDYWAANVNKTAANVIPGIDEVNKWIIKHLLLNSMAVLEWEWEPVIIDGKKYTLPMKITIHNALSTILSRLNDIFLNEEVYIKLNRLEKTMNNINNTTQVNSTLDRDYLKKSSSWHEIPSLLGMPSGPGRRKLQGFVIKYNWSPGDNTSTVSGTDVTTGQGVYPQPSFYGLNEVLLMRRQLAAADISILDGIINYIIDWSIGDDTKDANGKLVNQPKPAQYDKSGKKISKSTIEIVKEMITTSNRGNVMQLFHPYYYKLNIITPPVESLLSTEKYIQSTVEMMQAFGIFLSPTDRRVDFTNIDTANFEQMLSNIRKNHMERFWESLGSEIVNRNKGKFSGIPNMIFNPLNTQDDKFRAGLLALAKIGKVSIDSLLKSHKLDKKTELLRIMKEVQSGEKALMDANVPISFVQSVVNPDGSGKDVSQSSTAEGGRPKEDAAKPEEPEKPVEPKKSNDDLDKLIKLKKLEILKKQDGLLNTIYKNNEGQVSEDSE